MTITVNNKEYRVRFEYHRALNTLNDEFFNTGTTCLINDDVLGDAFCNPNDNFCKETGRKIALYRALKDGLKLDKAERRLFWFEWFRQRGKSYKKTEKKNKV